MKKFIVLIIFYFSFACSSLIAQDTIVDLDKISQNNINSDKKVMLYFHITNCPYCIRMERNTLKDKKIKKLIDESFVFVDINTQKDGKVLFRKKLYQNKEFSDKYNVQFFPTILFLDKENEVIYKARGYRDINTFQLILNYMITDMFEEMSFFEYLEESKSSLKDKE
jgi:thioredoxin-related protein